MDEGTRSSDIPHFEARNVLITGGAGFIASHVAILLATKYPRYRVVVVDKLDYCANLNNLRLVAGLLNFKFVKGDIRSADFVTHVMHAEEIDTVMHFAAQTHVDNSFGNSIEFTENNIKGTHVLLESIKTLGTVKRFLHISTDDVYGESSYKLDKDNFEVASLLEPTNPYAATKAAAEMLVMAYGRSYGLPYIITRGNNVYGPHQYPEKAIPKFIMLARNGSQIPIHGDGMATRSYMHVRDAVAAFDIILHKGTLREIYNLGAFEKRTVLSVARDIGIALGKDISQTIVHVQDRIFKDRRYFIDCSKLHALGWKQKVSWEDGLKETIEWYVENDESSGYWGDVSGALLAHSTGSTQANILGDVYSTLAEMTASEKEEEEAAKYEEKKPVFLVYGRKGLIGSKLGMHLTELGHKWAYGRAQLEDRESVKDDMDRSGCTHIVCDIDANASTYVGYGEDYVTETVRANVIGILSMCDVARQKSVHVTNFVMGCIYKDDAEYTPDAKPREDGMNYCGSFYPEMMLRHYTNVMQFCVHMPIDGDLQNPRNLITKISNRPKVCHVRYSFTVLEEFVPIAVDGALRGLTGSYNWTNPGSISHNEILKLYREYLHPEFTWDNFTKEEEAELMNAPRSNTMHDGNMRRTFPQVLDIKASIIKNVLEPNKKLGLRAPGNEKSNLAYLET